MDLALKALCCGLDCQVKQRYPSRRPNSRSTFTSLYNIWNIFVDVNTFSLSSFKQPSEEVRLSHESHDCANATLRRACSRRCEHCSAARWPGLRRVRTCFFCFQNGLQLQYNIVTVIKQPWRMNSISRSNKPLTNSVHNSTCQPAQKKKKKKQLSLRWRAHTGCLC